MVIDKGGLDMYEKCESEKKQNAIDFSSNKKKNKQLASFEDNRVSNITQLRSFSTAISETGITPPENLKEVVGAGALSGGGEADLVVAENLTQSKDMEHATNQAASRFAKVGDAANKVRKTPTYLAASGPGFVAYNDGNTPNGLEPFIFRVKAPYRKGKKTHFIQFDYQQANPYRGYIVRQKDTGDTHTSEISVNGVTNPQEKAHADTFNMAHANTGSQELSSFLDQSENLSRETNEARLDARAKLGGEGPRWLLVRNNSSKITDDSKIWTRHKGKVYSVTFRTLWLNWLSVFECEYDIPDSIVADKLVHSNNWTIEPVCKKFNRFSSSSKDIQVQ